jgi:hypothetical protein
LNYSFPNVKNGVGDSVVGLATGYGLYDQEVVVRVPIGSRIFFFPRCPRPALGPTQPQIQWASREISLAVKRPRGEAEHSPPSRAEVKNDGAIPPLPYVVIVSI